MKKLLLILFVSLLAGCASMAGVNFSDDEKEACAALAGAPEDERCTVWTPDELQQLSLYLLQQGYMAGARSAGRKL